MPFITRYRPINGLVSLPRELDRWMDEALGSMQWGAGENLRQWFPVADVSETPEQSFERSFTLPSHYDHDQVRATMEDGVLTVRIPRREEARAREIQIESGA